MLLTTHLMDEGGPMLAAGDLDRGRLAACDTPAAMKERIGGDVISLATRQPQRVAEIIHGPDFNSRRKRWTASSAWSDSAGTNSCRN